MSDECPLSCGNLNEIRNMHEEVEQCSKTSLVKVKHACIITVSKL